MKKEPSHTPGSSKPSRHQFQHEVPTQIHDPEQDMMLLARWFHRALKNPAKFWGTLAAIAGGILALVILSNMVSFGSSSSHEVWTKLELAKTPAERVVLAEDHPQSPAAPWARLQAATEYYNQGFADLPNNRDVALPTLKKALDNFDAVAKAAPADSPAARAAAIGKARTLEARNELTKAVEQYQLVAKTWPGTAEAAEAKQMSESLQKPEAAAFYKDLYAYAPPKVTLPPGGSQNLEMPLLPSPPGGSTPGDAATSGLPATIPLLPPPPALPAATTDEPKVKAKATAEKPASPPAADKTAKPAAGTIPEIPFEGGAAPKSQPTAPAPKAETPKPASPAPAKTKS